MLVINSREEGGRGLGSFPGSYLSPPVPAAGSVHPPPHGTPSFPLIREMGGEDGTGTEGTVCYVSWLRVKRVQSLLCSD